MRSSLKPLVNAVLLLVLSACTSLPEPDRTTGRTLPPDTAPWTASGKVAVSSDNLSATANFIWTRRSRDWESVRFTGPFGIGAIRIFRESDHVYWLDGRQRRPLSDLGLQPGTAHILATLPFSELGNWLVGARRPDGRTWTQNVSEWQRFPPWEIPRRMTFDNGDTRLRLVLNHWMPK